MAMKHMRRRDGQDIAWLLRWIEDPDPTKCWHWTGAKAGRKGDLQNNYGRVCFKGVLSAAHRISYLLHKGEIPPGLQLDHLCRNRACINPAHLEAVTPKENQRRGMAREKLLARNAIQQAKTHCPFGHPYAGTNLRVDKRGQRNCVTCSNRRSLEWRIRNGRTSQELSL